MVLPSTRLTGLLQGLEDAGPEVRVSKKELLKFSQVRYVEQWL